MVSKTEIPAPRARHDFADLLIVSVAALTLAFAIVFLFVLQITNSGGGTRDFVVYWATGQQLAHHANPYDADAMLRMEDAAGFAVKGRTQLMRNPPWGLAVALPLGFLGLRSAALVWSMALIASLALSVRLIWRMNGSPANFLHLIGLTFAPALLCLMMGQTTLFAMLGFVLFLYLHRGNPFLAGASLWLCALKPHLFLPIGVVLVVWILVTRSYRLIMGAVFALAASSLLATIVFPAVWTDYALMFKSTGVAADQVPCLSVALRLWLRPETLSLSYLPTALSCVWGLAYFWRRRHAWDWMTEGSLLMLVSLLTAPYSWLFDNCVAMPALLQGAYQTTSRTLITILVFASVTVTVGFSAGVGNLSLFYLWTAPAWLAWYLFATNLKGTAPKSTPIASPSFAEPL